MRAAALCAGLAAISISISSAARAEDIPFDARMPVRAGFAYTGISRAPAFSFSWGVDVDVAQISRRLAFTTVLDFDAEARPELSDKDPLSAFSEIGLGAGLFYVTEGSVGLGFETTFSMTFDAKDLAGGGLMTRAFVIPFYVPLNEAAKSHADRFGAWVRSSLSLWVLGRVDWTKDGNGGTVAFGGAIDVMRIFFLPYLELLTTKLR